MLEPIPNYDSWKLREPPEPNDEPYDHCSICHGAIWQGDTVYIVHGKACCRECIENSMEIAG